MCGIAGFVGKGTEENLHKMVYSIRHRGPDSQDIYKQDELGFVHARLSIIDLSTGANQPFFNDDKSLVMVFNGEIYNYLELKEEIYKLRKYTFRTTSDTEVLLYLFQEYGVEMLQKINGMFAFAIYDFQKKELFVAKDRLGKKPLYYGIFNGTFIFASEPKAILQHPLATKELNINALNQYLTFDYVPTTNSIFQNIYKLEAAHYLIFKNKQIITKNRYWHISFEPNNFSYADAKDKLDSLLNKATAQRMLADVPLGVFLSGGLDSSTVAYYAQKNSTTPIQTFSIGFEDKSYNEADYATAVAKHLNTEHHTQYLSAQQSLDLVPEISSKLDEPFADASIIPTYFLSKFTRSKVTVSLGGDGSDELLAGYPTFISDNYIDLYKGLPNFLKSFISQTTKLLPVSDKNISLDFKIRQFLQGFEMDKEYTSTLWLGSFTPSEKQKVFSKNALSSITNTHGLGIVDDYLSEVKNAGAFEKLLYTYYRTYLLDDILVKVDRASMYTSLEVRAPFLDYHLVEFLSGLPKDYKIQGSNVKRILKDLMRDKIPNNIIDRPKKGFGIPLSSWIRKELKPLCDELLSEESLKKHDLFDYSYINKIKNDHYEVKQNNRKYLWNLMMFQLWYNEWIG